MTLQSPFLIIRLGVNPSIIINSRMTYYDKNITMLGILLKVNKGQASSCRYYFYCMVPYFELPGISASNKRWHSVPISPSQTSSRDNVSHLLYFSIASMM